VAKKAKRTQALNKIHPRIRIGFGIDIHQLRQGIPLVVGGVNIPSDKGAHGHSDADVLIHAICDALLGAANLRDIGQHFPDTDPRYKGANSRIFLEETFKLIQQKGFSVGNIDSTVLLEQPKLNPHVPEMAKNIAGILNIDQENVSIKATRGEKMGPVGEGIAIQAYATVLIFGD
jgi:2-C-methyl-D-erythritol 2,4-cyclodiphosphate synthase